MFQFLCLLLLPQTGIVRLTSLVVVAAPPPAINFHLLHCWSEACSLYFGGRFPNPSISLHQPPVARCLAAGSGACCC